MHQDGFLLPVFLAWPAAEVAVSLLMLLRIGNTLVPRGAHKLYVCFFSRAGLFISEP